MTDILTERVCAEIEGDGGAFVVFLIGMRINRPWKFWRWLPVAAAMPRMLRELAARPELGLLHAQPRFGLRNLWVIQYWKSAAHLRAYAHAVGHAHLPAWRSFNARIGTGGDVGIWHETFVVPAGHAESVYVNMPRHGLGRAGTLFPARGDRATAARRLRGLAQAGGDAAGNADSGRTLSSGATRDAATANPAPCGDPT